MSTAETINLYVTGLTCGHCVASVTEELEEIPAVTGVEVSLVKEGESLAAVSAASPIDDDRLREAIQEAGYDLVRIERS